MATGQSPLTITTADTSAGLHKGRLQVLLVEPKPQAVSAFRLTFESLLDIAEQPAPTAALLALRSGTSADVIVLHAPGHEVSFLESLQNDDQLKSIPVILLTDQRINLREKPFQGRVIDVYPPDYPADTLRNRFSYLQRKKQYVETERESYKAQKVSIPVGKRIFDVVVSFTVLLMLSPILLIVAILVKLDSPGPIFYGSKRVGTGYKIFSMWKFRTMRTGADKMIKNMASQNMYNKEPVAQTTDGLCDDCRAKGVECQRPLFLDNKQICEIVYQREQKDKAMFMKFKEDPRVTRLGKILRNTSIDELPQLYNILVGDMSFVGNRPLPPYEAEKLTSTAYARRFAAPAGLTGLWQVTKRGKTAVSDQERIQLDILYARKYSFKTDLIILLKTVKAVFQKENV